ncbi:hypothetical protein [Cupriavidus metallidurans]|uniref:hypothetical protein n=1 Tax=Cupriavidus metallidurans TaxID=119219 RepID=UPI001CCFFA2C|nr:hypothetical protein [Cupriavidus metallidurans]UBM12706.1 hypothetical protein LAI70_28240 [Cupriavidus metallidurans]
MKPVATDAGACAIEDIAAMLAPSASIDPVIGIPASVISRMVGALAFYAGMPTPGFDNGAAARAALQLFQQ